MMSIDRFRQPTSVSFPCEFWRGFLFRVPLYPKPTSPGVNSSQSTGNLVRKERPPMKHKLPMLLASLLALTTLGVAQDQPSAKAQERVIKEVRHELLMLPYFGVFD